MGDLCACPGPPNAIVKGSATVLIGGLPAARLGDATAHGGAITNGCATVLIGGRIMDKLHQSCLGTGWGFPPEFDIQQGSVGMLSVADVIRRSVEIIISTGPGELVM